MGAPCRLSLCLITSDFSWDIPSLLQVAAQAVRYAVLYLLQLSSEVTKELPKQNRQMREEGGRSTFAPVESIGT